MWITPLLLQFLAYASADTEEASAHDPNAFWRSLPYALLSAFTWMMVHCLASPAINMFAPSWHKIIDSSKHDVLHVRVVGIIHAIVICVCSTNAIIHNWNDAAFLADSLFNFSAASQIPIVIAAGYFIWDLGICIYYGWGIAFMFHGAMCCTLYFIAMGSFVHLAAPVFLLFELSTPSLHLRWLLIQLKAADTTFFKVVNLSFAGLFFLVRLVAGLPLSYILVIEPSNSAIFSGRMAAMGVPVWHAWLNVVGMVLLDCLNVFWFSQMVMSVMKRDTKKTEGKAE